MTKRGVCVGVSGVEQEFWLMTKLFEGGKIHVGKKFILQPNLKSSKKAESDVFGFIAHKARNLELD
jgi:hypothetical protein